MIKAAIRKNEVKNDGKVNIKIRVFHNRKSRYIGTKYNVLLKQFSVKSGRVLKTHPDHAYINAELKKLEANYESKLIKIEGVERKTVTSIVSTLQNKRKVIDLFKLFDAKIAELKKNDSSTWEKYHVTAVVLEKFVGSRMLGIQAVDRKFLKDFSDARLAQGKSVNTVSLDLRNIRAVINKGIDDELVPLDLYPFRKFKIPSKATVKRNLTVTQMKALYTADLKGKEKQSVDIFMLSFFLIGVNMKDLYLMTPANITGDRLVYDRAKTGRQYVVKIEPEAMEIINRYRDPSNKRLFTFYKQYSERYNFVKCVNKFLKDVVTRLKISSHITTYYARHSWATIAFNNGIPKDVVIKALGHGKQDVTDTYIDFDLVLVDEANRKIIDLIV